MLKAVQQLVRVHRTDAEDCGRLSDSQEIEKGKF